MVLQLFLLCNRRIRKVWDTYDAILEACFDAWKSFALQPERLTSITNRSWANAVTE